jgi:hypothetical protein
MGKRLRKWWSQASFKLTNPSDDPQSWCLSGGSVRKAKMMASMVIFLAIQMANHYDARQSKQRNDQPLDPQKKVAGHA